MDSESASGSLPIQSGRLHTSQNPSAGRFAIEKRPPLSYLYVGKRPVRQRLRAQLQIRMRAKRPDFADFAERAHRQLRPKHHTLNQVFTRIHYELGSRHRVRNPRTIIHRIENFLRRADRLWRRAKHPIVRGRSGLAGCIAGIE